MLGNLQILIFILSILVSLSATAIVGAIPGEIPKNNPAYYNTVAFVKKTDANGGLKIFCSGAILSKKIIMTAKHCLGDRKIEDIQVYFGNDTNNIDAALLRKVTKSSIYGPKDWQSYFPSFDFAWVELESTIPNSDGTDPDLPHFRPIPILANANLLSHAKTIHLAGYGNQATELMKVIAGEKKHVAIGFKKYIDTPQVSSLLLFEGEMGHSNCHGDSGGPAYALINNPQTGKNEWYVAGTASGFDLALTPKSYKVNPDDDIFPHLALCDKSQTLYTFVGDYINWLETTTGVSIPQFGKKRTLLPGIFKKQEISKNQFTHWCENSDFTNPEWLTLRQMLIAAMENSTTDFSQEEIFLDCNTAETALNTLTSLEFDEITKFENLKPIATIPSIKHLRFSKTKIPNLTPLVNSAVTEITLVDMNINTIESVNGLSRMNQLRSLKISNNNLSNIDSLYNLPNLEKLDISRNKISDISVLSELKKLSSLDFFGNQVSDISPLYELNELKLLIASINQIVSMPAPNGTWPKLEEIIIADNLLTDVEFLRDANNLKKVVISQNNISSLAPLDNKNIKRLAK